MSLRHSICCLRVWNLDAIETTQYGFILHRIALHLEKTALQALGACNHMKAAQILLAEIVVMLPIISTNPIKESTERVSPKKKNAIIAEVSGSTIAKTLALFASINLSQVRCIM